MVYMGVAWGLSFSLAKIATELGAKPIGISFWQACISGIILLLYLKVTNKKIILSAEIMIAFLILACIGNIFPSLAFYYAASKVSAGILSITVTLIPILTYGLALLVRQERFSLVRLIGLIFGFVAICIIIFPETSLPSRSAAVWVLVASLSSLFYASENIYLTMKNFDRIGPVRLACGMNLTAAIMLSIPAILSDNFYMPIATSVDLILAVFGLGVISATTYTIFIYTIRTSGAIFTSQVGYLVTIFGLLWGIFLFSEKHSAWIWASFALMMVGLFLVRPQKVT
jgi:drug/metabolite transporter (DMT)-like permease